MLVPFDLPLEDTYNLLLRSERKFRLADESGQSICRHCTRHKNQHLDARCSISVLSREFSDINQEEWDKTKRALVLIEELKTL